ISKPAPTPFDALPAYDSYLRCPPKWHQLADAAVAADGAVFPLVRQSRLTCDPAEADWGLRYSTPVVTVVLPYLGDVHELASLLRDMAMREHLHGDDATALELIRDVRHIA